MEKNIFIIVLLLAVGIVLNSSLYVLTPENQAVITQFGKPVGKPVVDFWIAF